MRELQYLVTYNLVNNFYFNLVSWSPLNNAIAIAIDSKTYWWDGSSQVRDMNIQRPGLAPVSCVACSNGDAVAISFSDGFFGVYQITQKRRPASRQFSASVQCVEWFPDGKRLFTGDLTGAVCLLAYDGSALRMLCHFPGFTQQICGFSLNRDCSQVAVGANENLAIVWDISTATEPREMCRLPHMSAVKGILFCPWAPSLLATGGGSNDRHLRFWHTGSGALLQEIDTKRQITSVFWSSFYKELLLTFGFLATDDHVAAAIYKYPGSEITALAQVRDPLRALSATMAPDQTKVAIAANDGTVRVFGLWNERPYALTEAPASVAVGSYGSTVVESCEGIDLRGPSVR
ncbi:WD40 repeat-like protein [Metschnikowia bicuspidata var. bicuspidata NRRL YB-4993]|uniref:WD40 repeat-like protein n=1 Tax=Metschnikowia bicuspidata var. bicuspidata NRRL YB-4993 TaxID=869754 RepID=A0A1A0HKV0_9ASCO|nr:WD40 repeat-like protein [Metschnikowia bicuspidata var. bicuspidata NRRL YB-4993]OBA24433.1 WD40 repeat-like protein [Metschnikowia bicuspidata var. bicuspidata NRRL YB-4993]